MNQDTHWIDAGIPKRFSGWGRDVMTPPGLAGWEGDLLQPRSGSYPPGSIPNLSAPHHEVASRYSHAATPALHSGTPQSLYVYHPIQSPTPGMMFLNVGGRPGERVLSETGTGPGRWPVDEDALQQLRELNQISRKVRQKRSVRELLNMKMDLSDADNPYAAHIVDACPQDWLACNEEDMQRIGKSCDVGALLEKDGRLLVSSGGSLCFPRTELERQLRNTPFSQVSYLDLESYVHDMESKFSNLKRTHPHLNEYANLVHKVLESRTVKEAQASMESSHL